MISRLRLATPGTNTKPSTSQLDREGPGENRQLGFRVKAWFKHPRKGGSEGNGRARGRQTRGKQKIWAIKLPEQGGRGVRRPDQQMGGSEKHPLTHSKGVYQTRHWGLSREQTRPQASWRVSEEKQQCRGGWRGTRGCWFTEGGRGRSLRRRHFSGKRRSKLCRHRGEERRQDPGREISKCKGPGAVGAAHRAWTRG